ncbi:hypothetical protein Tco_0002124 [Tanacetum coccineum]
MSALKFVDSHNMVAFLAKPTESEGFEQIVDFLNANPIKYALTVNPTIYTSCIKQFWATAKQLTHIGYEKPSQKLAFYKAFFSPQWKFLIHTILKCLSAKSTAWNEFSSTMASAIICLATNQKFNFSKYIIESMVKNVDSSVKFLMYPRFVQVFLDKQVGDMSTHDEIIVTPSHTKKVFSHMKRVRKGFSGAVTPLFPTLMVQAQEEMGEHTIADEAANEENVPTHSNDPPLSGEDSLKLKDLMEICTKLQQRVLDLKNTKTAQAQEISSLKLRVKRLEKKRGLRTYKLKRLFKVGRSAQVVSSEDEGLGDQEDVSEQGRKIDDIDKDAEVTLVDKTQGRYGDDLAFDISVLDGEKVFVMPEQREKVVRRSNDWRLEKPLKMKEQIRLDEELAFKLQAEEEEQERLAREKAEEVEDAYISWDNVQAMIEADRLFDERLQAREQE